MSNETRKFLVTKFVCAKCGSNLSLTYDMPKTVGGLSSYERGEPTGADMVNNFIARKWSVIGGNQLMTMLSATLGKRTVTSIGQSQRGLRQKTA